MSSKQFLQKTLERREVPLRDNISIRERRNVGGSLDIRPESTFALEELVQCPICFERFQRPKTLTCQHSFCLSCLQNHVVGADVLLNVKNEDKLKIRCPTCKSETVVEGPGGLENLQENFYINSLLKVLESSKQSTPSTPKPEQRCIKCETICEFNAASCQHCKQLFCKICWNKHLSELEEKLTTMASQLNEAEVRLSHKNDDLERKFNQLEHTIKQTTDAKINELKEKEEKLLKQVNGLRTDENNISSDIVQKIEDLKMRIEKLNFKIIDENQRVPLFMSIHRNTSTLLEEVSQWGEYRTVFDADAFALDEDNEGFNVETDDVSMKAPPDPFESNETLTKHYKTRTFTPKFQTNKFPRITGLAISPWSSNIYMAAPDNKSILIMNMQKNKLVGKLSSSELLCPRAIAFSKYRNEIYVTDKWKHCIHVFATNGEYLKALCSKGSTDGKIVSPEGIAVNRDNEILVCDTGNDRILIVDPETGKQKSIIGWIQKRTILNMPTSVAVTDDNLIVVADNGNHRVKIFKSNGELSFEFGSLGRERRQFRSAEIVVVDALGFILVGDSGNARVQIFDQKGNLVKVFGGLGDGNGKFKWISGIAITSKLEIVVSDHKNRTLQIF